MPSFDPAPLGIRFFARQNRAAGEHPAAMSDLWKGLNASAQQQLAGRDYSKGTVAERLATSGVDAAELFAAPRAELAAAWIPGVELFPRTIYAQRARGCFGELARAEEGPLHAIGMWPKQWAAATLYAGTAKGFHIHPPHLPDGVDPAAWFRKLYVEEPGAHHLRPYDREQWDAMFFLTGSVEMLLVDERAGLPRRRMRFIILGDNHRGPNNAGVIIPPGVAHALKTEGSEDVISVYGTSTKFDPANEGRIASGVETARLPEDWERYLAG
jgi:dTDP-4-dehydrorhamnose 3,5-epimerase-like enzyme